jgi:hypothetical protein
VGGVIARQRLFAAAQAQQDQPQIGVRIGAGAVDQQGRPQQPQGGVALAALIIEHGAEVQPVEMARIAAQNVGIDPLRLLQLAAFVGAPGTAEQGRHFRRRMPHLPASSEMRVSTAPARRRDGS